MLGLGKEITRGGKKTSGGGFIDSAESKKGVAEMLDGSLAKLSERQPAEIPKGKAKAKAKTKAKSKPTPTNDTPPQKDPMKEAVKQLQKDIKALLGLSTFLHRPFR